MSKIGPDHFRYYADITENGVVIRCERFVVIGETARCWYVIRADRANLANIDWSTASDWRKKLRKRVLKATSAHVRRYCYPDKLNALHSFQQRQKWRISHATRNLETAQASLKAIEGLLTSDQAIPDSIKAGHTQYTSQLVWHDY